MKFKETSYFYNIKMQDEATSAAVNYLENLNKIFDEDNYVQQISNIDETALYIGRSYHPGLS